MNQMRLKLGAISEGESNEQTKGQVQKATGIYIISGLANRKF